MWDSVNNDLKSIIYRYVHGSYHREVLTQYHDNFQVYWYDAKSLFKHKDSDGRYVLLLNYRPMTYASYRSVGVDHTIYGFNNSTRRYVLSPNYYHSSIWLSKPVVTHERHTK